jgi:hypothetical protein
MGRRIRVSAADTRAVAVGRRATNDLPDNPTDGYLARIVKYVPAEVIAVFTGVVNFYQGHHGGSGLLNLSPALFSQLFYALIVITPIYILLVTREKNQPLAVTQAIVSTILFLAFAYATPGSPFSPPDCAPTVTATCGQFPLHQYYNSIVATAILPVALFIAGFIVPKPRPIPQ